MEKTKRMPKLKDLVGAADHEDDNVSEKTVRIFLDQIFGNHVITDCILDKLCIWEILEKCSLVCKIWNTVSREYLRRRRVCLLWCDLTFLRGLEHRRAILENDVLNCNHPFQGVTMRIYDGFEWVAITDDYELDITNALEGIFTLTTSKHIRIYISNQYKPVDERGQPWLFNVFRNRPRQNETEHLRILGEVSTNWLVQAKANPHTNLPTLEGFPHLKTFQADYVPQIEETKDCFAAAFIRGCPALTEFRAAVDIETIKLFDELNKLRVIRWVHLHHSDILEPRILERIKELAVPIEVLSVKRINSTPQKMQCVRQLVQICSKTLRKIILVDFCLGELSWELEPFETIQEIVARIPKGANFYDYELVSDRSHNPVFKVFPNANHRFVNKPASHYYDSSPSGSWSEPSDVEASD